MSVYSFKPSFHPRQSKRRQLLVSALVLLLLVSASILGLLVLKKSQDNRQQAAGCQLNDPYCVCNSSGVCTSVGEDNPRDVVKSDDDLVSKGIVATNFTGTRATGANQCTGVWMNNFCYMPGDELAEGWVVSSGTANRNYPHLVRKEVYDSPTFNQETVEKSLGSTTEKGEDCSGQGLAINGICYAFGSTVNGYLVMPARDSSSGCNNSTGDYCYAHLKKIAVSYQDWQAAREAYQDNGDLSSLEKLYRDLYGVNFTVGNLFDPQASNAEALKAQALLAALTDSDSLKRELELANQALIDEAGGVDHLSDYQRAQYEANLANIKVVDRDYYFDSLAQSEIDQFVQNQLINQNYQSLIIANSDRDLELAAANLFAQIYGYRPDGRYVNVQRLIQDGLGLDWASLVNQQAQYRQSLVTQPAEEAEQPSTVSGEQQAELYAYVTNPQVDLQQLVLDHPEIWGDLTKAAVKNLSQQQLLSLLGFVDNGQQILQERQVLQAVNELDENQIMKLAREKLGSNYLALDVANPLKQALITLLGADRGKVVYNQLSVTQTINEGVNKFINEGGVGQLDSNLRTAYVAQFGESRAQQVIEQALLSGRDVNQLLLSDLIGDDQAENILFSKKFQAAASTAAQDRNVSMMALCQEVLGSSSQCLFDSESNSASTLQKMLATNYDQATANNLAVSYASQIFQAGQEKKQEAYQESVVANFVMSGGFSGQSAYERSFLTGDHDAAEEALENQKEAFNNIELANQLAQTYSVQNTLAFAARDEIRQDLSDYNFNTVLAQALMYDDVFNPVYDRQTDLGLSAWDSWSFQWNQIETQIFGVANNVENIATNLTIAQQQQYAGPLNTNVADLAAQAASNLQLDGTDSLLGYDYQAANTGYYLGQGASNVLSTVAGYGTTLAAFTNVNSAINPTLSPTANSPMTWQESVELGKSIEQSLKNNNLENRADRVLADQNLSAEELTEQQELFVSFNTDQEIVRSRQELNWETVGKVVAPSMAVLAPAVMLVPGANVALMTGLISSTFSVYQGASMKAQALELDRVELETGDRYNLQISNSLAAQGIDIAQASQEQIQAEQQLLDEQIKSLNDNANLQLASATVGFLTSGAGIANAAGAAQLGNVLGIAGRAGGISLGAYNAVNSGNLAAQAFREGNTTEGLFSVLSTTVSVIGIAGNSIGLVQNPSGNVANITTRADLYMDIASVPLDSAVDIRNISQSCYNPNYPAGENACRDAWVGLALSLVNDTVQIKNSVAGFQQNQVKNAALADYQQRLAEADRQIGIVGSATNVDPQRLADLVSYRNQLAGEITKLDPSVSLANLPEEYQKVLPVSSDDFDEPIFKAAADAKQLALLDDLRTAEANSANQRLSSEALLAKQQALVELEDSLRLEIQTGQNDVQQRQLEALSAKVQELNRAIDGQLTKTLESEGQLDQAQQLVDGATTNDQAVNQRDQLLLTETEQILAVLRSSNDPEFIKDQLVSIRQEIDEQTSLRRLLGALLTGDSQRQADQIVLGRELDRFMTGELDADQFYRSVQDLQDQGSKRLITELSEQIDRSVVSQPVTERNLEEVAVIQNRAAELINDYDRLLALRNQGDTETAEYQQLASNFQRSVLTDTVVSDLVNKISQPDLVDQLTQQKQGLIGQSGLDDVTQNLLKELTEVKSAINRGSSPELVDNYNRLLSELNQQILGDKPSLANYQQLAQAQAVLKQTDLLSATESLLRQGATSDELANSLGSSEYQLPLGDEILNTQLNTIIRDVELRSGASENVEFFNTRDNQLDTILKSLAAQRNQGVAIELTTAGGKTFVGSVLLKAANDLLNYDVGLYVAKPGQETEIVNSLSRAYGLAENDILILDFKRLGDQQYVKQVLDSRYLVADPSQIEFIRNSANRVADDHHQAAKLVYSKLSDNASVYIDELQINLDPSRQAINSVGASSELINDQDKNTAQRVGQVLDQTLLDDQRWGLGDYDFLINHTSNGAAVAKFDLTKFDSVFAELARLTDLDQETYKQVALNAVELAAAQKSGEGVLADKLQSLGLDVSNEQLQRIFSEVDMLNTFAQGLTMKNGTDYLRMVDSVLKEQQGLSRELTVPAAGGVANEGQSYSARLQAAMEYIGARANNQAVNFDGLSASPNQAYKSTIADFLGDLNNSSITAVTGAMADGRGVAEVALGLTTYRSTEAVVKILGLEDSRTGGRINVDRAYVVDRQDQLQAVMALKLQGLLDQSQGQAANGNLKLVMAFDGAEEPRRFAQGLAANSSFSDSRFAVQEADGSYSLIKFDSNGEIADIESKLTTKDIQNFYDQAETANLVTIIGRGGATGDSIRTAKNVPGITLTSMDSPEGLIAQGGARIDRGSDIADQYALIVANNRLGQDIIRADDTKTADAYLLATKMTGDQFVAFRQNVTQVQIEVERALTTRALDQGVLAASTRVLADLVRTSDNERIARWASDQLLDFYSRSKELNLDLATADQESLAARRQLIAQEASRWQDLLNDPDNRALLRRIERNYPDLYREMQINAGVDSQSLAYSQVEGLSKEAVITARTLEDFLSRHQQYITAESESQYVAKNNVDSGTAIVQADAAASPVRSVLVSQDTSPVTDVGGLVSRLSVIPQNLRSLPQLISQSVADSSLIKQVVSWFSPKQVAPEFTAAKETLSTAIGDVSWWNQRALRAVETSDELYALVKDQFSSLNTNRPAINSQEQFTEQVQLLAETMAEIKRLQEQSGLEFIKLDWQGRPVLDETGHFVRVNQDQFENLSTFKDQAETKIAQLEQEKEASFASEENASQTIVSKDLQNRIVNFVDKQIAPPAVKVVVFLQDLFDKSQTKSIPGLWRRAGVEFSKLSSFIKERQAAREQQRLAELDQAASQDQATEQVAAVSDQQIQDLQNQFRLLHTRIPKVTTDNYAELSQQQQQLQLTRDTWQELSGLQQTAEQTLSTFITTAIRQIATDHQLTQTAVRQAFYNLDESGQPAVDYQFEAQNRITELINQVEGHRQLVKQREQLINRIQQVLQTVSSANNYTLKNLSQNLTKLIKLAEALNNPDYLALEINQDQGNIIQALKSLGNLMTNQQKVLAKQVTRANQLRVQLLERGIDFDQGDFTELTEEQLVAWLTEATILLETSQQEELIEESSVISEQQEVIDLSLVGGPKTLIFNLSDEQLPVNQAEQKHLDDEQLSRVTPVTEFDFSRSLLTEDVPGRDSISRESHTQFQVDQQAGTLLMRDSGSTNGTYINGQRLSSQVTAILEPGDRIGVGLIQTGDQYQFVVDWLVQVDNQGNLYLVDQNQQLAIVGFHIDYDSAQQTINQVSDSIDGLTTKDKALNYSSELIGRAINSELASDSLISRRHAFLYRGSDGSLAIQDNASNNGIRIIGQDRDIVLKGSNRVVRLMAGDQVVLGRTSLRIVYNRNNRVYELISPDSQVIRGQIVDISTDVTNQTAKQLSSVDQVIPERIAELLSDYKGWGTIAERLVRDQGYSVSGRQIWLYSPDGKYVGQPITVNTDDGETVQLQYKMHFSVQADDMEAIAEMTDFLRQLGILHKVTPGKDILTEYGDKQLGKAITIYVQDPDVMAQVADKATELAQRYHGFTHQDFARVGANLQYEREVPGTNGLLYYTLDAVLKTDPYLSTERQKYYLGSVAEVVIGGQVYRGYAARLDLMNKFSAADPMWAWLNKKSSVSEVATDDSLAKDQVIDEPSLRGNSLSALINQLPKTNNPQSVPVISQQIIDQHTVVKEDGQSYLRLYRGLWSNTDLQNLEQLSRMLRDQDLNQAELEQLMTLTNQQADLDWYKMANSHRGSSSDSPFISLTTDKKIAREWGGTGYVITVDIPLSEISRLKLIDSESLSAVQGQPAYGEHEYLALWQFPAGWISDIEPQFIESQIDPISFDRFYTWRHWTNFRNTVEMENDQAYVQELDNWHQQIMDLGVLPKDLLDEIGDLSRLAYERTIVFDGPVNQPFLQGLKPMKEAKSLDEVVSLLNLLKASGHRYLLGSDLDSLIDQVEAVKQNFDQVRKIDNPLLMEQVWSVIYSDIMDRAGQQLEADEQSPSFNSLCSDCQQIRQQTQAGVEAAQALWQQAQDLDREIESLKDRLKYEGDSQTLKNEIKTVQHQQQQLTQQALTTLKQTEKNLVNDHTMANQCVQLYLNAWVYTKEAEIKQNKPTVRKAVNAVYDATLLTEEILASETANGQASMTYISNPGFLNGWLFGAGKKVESVVLSQEELEQVIDIKAELQAMAEFSYDNQGLRHVVIDGRLSDLLIITGQASQQEQLVHLLKQTWQLDQAEVEQLLNDPQWSELFKSKRFVDDFADFSRKLQFSAPLNLQTITNYLRFYSLFNEADLKANSFAYEGLTTVDQDFLEAFFADRELATIFVKQFSNKSNFYAWSISYLEEAFINGADLNLTMDRLLELATILDSNHLSTYHIYSFLTNQSNWWQDEYLGYLQQNFDVLSKLIRSLSWYRVGNLISSDSLDMSSIIHAVSDNYQHLDGITINQLVDNLPQIKRWLKKLDKLGVDISDQSSVLASILWADQPIVIFDQLASLDDQDLLSKLTKLNQVIGYQYKFQDFENFSLSYYLNDANFDLIQQLVDHFQSQDGAAYWLNYLVKHTTQDVDLTDQLTNLLNNQQLARVMTSLTNPQRSDQAELIKNFIITYTSLSEEEQLTLLNLIESLNKSSFHDTASRILQLTAENLEQASGLISSFDKLNQTVALNRILVPKKKVGFFDTLTRTITVDEVFLYEQEWQKFNNQLNDNNHPLFQPVIDYLLNNSNMLAKLSLINDHFSDFELILSNNTDLGERALSLNDRFFNGVFDNSLVQANLTGVMVKQVETRLGQLKFDKSKIDQLELDQASSQALTDLWQVLDWYDPSMGRFNSTDRPKVVQLVREYLLLNDPQLEQLFIDELERDIASYFSQPMVVFQLILSPVAERPSLLFNYFVHFSNDHYYGDYDLNRDDYLNLIIDWVMSVEQDDIAASRLISLLESGFIDSQDEKIYQFAIDYGQAKTALSLISSCLDLTERQQEEILIAITSTEENISGDVNYFASQILDWLFEHDQAAMFKLILAISQNTLPLNQFDFYSLFAAKREIDYLDDNLRPNVHFWQDLLSFDLKLFTKCITVGDARARYYLANDQLLGKNREAIIGEIVEQSMIDGQLNLDVFRRSLLQVVHVFQDPNSTIIDEKLLFIDKYDPQKDSIDEEFQLKIKSLVDAGSTEKQALKTISREELRNLLIQSGSIEYQRDLEHILSVRDLTQTEVQSLQSDIQTMIDNRLGADEMNRQLYEQYEILKQTNDKQALADLIVPVDSVSQVGPVSDILPILQTATLADAFLGSLAFDQEFNLMSHVADTSLVGYMINRESGNYLAKRLPSLGNPHGIEFNRVYSTKNLSSPVLADDYMQMGDSHRVINFGLPSSAIVSIVVRQQLTKSSDLHLAKTQLARAGWYIPIFDENGEILLTPDEFDELRAVYYPLEISGYPVETMNSVWVYYLQLSKEHSSIQDGKKWQFLSKAVQEIKDQLANNVEPSLDLAVLTSFIRNNDLNSHDLSWYETSDFTTMFADIQASTNRKIVQRFANYQQQSRQYNHFIQAFSKQFKYIYPIASLNRALDEFQKQFDALIFTFTADPQSSIGANSGQLTTDIIRDLATYMTDNRRQLLSEIWQEAFTRLNDNAQPKDQLTSYQELLVPIMTGSGGRAEITLASDLDYEILVDDEQLPLVDGQIKEQFLADMQAFVNQQLSPVINQILNEQGIRPDAGLGKEDRTPFTLLSDIKHLKINFSARRQTIEPTEVMAYSPVFEKDQELVDQAKLYLFTNPSAADYSDFIDNDLIFREEDSFKEQFEVLFNSLAAGNDLEHIKEALQRVLNFKLFSLVAQANVLGYLSPEELSHLPSSTWELISYLQDQQILSDKGAEIMTNLLTYSYRLRFMAEVNSPEAQNTELKKVRNHNFKLEDLNYQERLNLFATLRDFRDEVLYADAYRLGLEELSGVDGVAE